MQQRIPTNLRNISFSVAFLLVVPTIAHLMFSWMGFSPTDDGFTLAYSRRIVDGEVPHRDFIIIRPFLSPLIHAPVVLFGGEYTFWISRFFVWFQFACVAWAWVNIADRAFGNPFGYATKLLLGLVGFAASVQLFVLTAWHTIDGMFLASIGMWVLVTRERPAGRFAGYLLLAAAYLCKQNYLLVAPFCVLLFGDWREKKYWLAVALPGLGYCAYLLATGAFAQAFLQLTAQTGLLAAGVESYLNYGFVLGVLAGLCAMLLSRAETFLPPRAGDVSRYARVAALIALPASLVSLGFYLGGLSTVAFGVFGMVLGAAMYRLAAGIARDGREEPVVFALLLLAWSASLSLGYNTPALLLGPLLAVLAALAFSTRGPPGPWFPRAMLVFAAVAVLVGFGASRPYHLYREEPSGELTAPLGGVLPGGEKIYTNPTTHAFLADLRDSTETVSAGGKRYAIIPEVPGWWARSEQPNPLPIDWPWPVELSDQRLTDRVTGDLEAHRGEVVVLVQKADALYLYDGFVPLNEDHYPVVEYVHTHFEKTHETEYFEFYE